MGKKTMKQIKTLKSTSDNTSLYIYKKKNTNNKNKDVFCKRAFSFENTYKKLENIQFYKEEIKKS